MYLSITGPLNVFSWASLYVSELASTIPEILRVISVLLNKEFHCRVLVRALQTISQTIVEARTVLS